MKVLLLSLLIIGLSTIILGTKSPLDEIERFDNYKVYNVFLANDDQLKPFMKLMKKYPVHLMRQGSKNGVPYYLSLEEAQRKSFEKELLELNIPFNTINENLQELLEQRYSAEERILSRTEMDWDSYHDLRTINSWIHKMAYENSFIKKHLIGFSAEFRPIYALHVAKNSNNKAIFIESNIHAIEWISSAVSTCFLNNMVSTNSELLDRFNWIFLPIMNPDGFHYTHTKNPLWRKNRRYNGHRNESGLCFGIDMNRNYDSHWGEAGYNLADPCDHFYAGKAPETEPEVRAAIRFESSFKKDYIRIHIAMHSYGQMLLLPYGHTDAEVPDNYDEMIEISAAFAEAAEAVHGFDYLYGTSGQLLGPVSGASKDYWYDHGIRYSATLELRDRGQYGFFLPSKFIKPTCEEVTAGLTALVNAAEQRGYFD